MFENQCKQSDTRGWKVRLVLINAKWSKRYFIGWKLEVWAETISLSAWN